MKVLVTGSRDWTDGDAIWAEIAQLPAGSVVIHGCCRGADLMAADAAKRMGYAGVGYPADWTTHGKAAGPIRNQHMLDREHSPESPIELCIAFHDDIGNSKGTGDMVRRALLAGIEVKFVLSSAALAGGAS